MTFDEYLAAVLTDQTLAPGGDELNALRSRGSDVKELLRSEFSEHSPSVRNAGSYKKGTMVRASYDFDVLVYLPHDTGVGENLKEIYDAVRDVLAGEYMVEPKRSAIKLHDATDRDDPVYFHVDVVPGRFMDGDDGDVALHQRHGEKNWLKTNPEKQIEHVRDSGVRDAIKLAKVWRENSGFRLATFVLELLVIDVLESHERDSLSNKMTRFWTELQERADDLTVEDPANASNDLSTILDTGAKASLSAAATHALNYLADENWEAIFGKVEKKSQEQTAAGLKAAAADISKPSRSYLDGDER